MSIIGFGLNDSDSAAMHRELIQFVGAFASLQDGIERTVRLVLEAGAPAITKVLLDTQMSDKRRIDLLVAVTSDVGYVVDTNLVRRTYDRLAKVRNAIGHAVKIDTYRAAGTDEVTAYFVRLAGTLKGSPESLTLDQLRRLGNEIEWITAHLWRLQYDNKLMRFMNALGKEVIPEIPPSAPKDGEPWSRRKSPK